MNIEIQKLPSRGKQTRETEGLCGLIWALVLAGTESSFSPWRPYFCEMCLLLSFLNKKIY